jgi:hypothetical protein
VATFTKGWEVIEEFLGIEAVAQFFFEAIQIWMQQL